MSLAAGTCFRHQSPNSQAKLFVLLHTPVWRTFRGLRTEAGIFVPILQRNLDDLPDLPIIANGHRWITNSMTVHLTAASFTTISAVENQNEFERHPAEPCCESALLDRLRRELMNSKHTPEKLKTEAKKIWGDAFNDPYEAAEDRYWAFGDEFS